MARSTRPFSVGRPITVSSTSRSVRSLATASSRGTRPFMGTSLLEVTMIRPGTGVTSSKGRNTVWSTPTGTTVIRSGATSIWATMSWREFCDTVTTAGSARATRTCMPRKPNHRLVVKRCQGFVVCERASWRSTVIGWCSVVSSGHPSETMPSMPVPRHWLSCTTSKSSRRRASSWRARKENASGSPKPAVHMIANSVQSSRDVNSRRCGTRNGSGWR